jgi:hypothetical protein
MSKSKKKYFMIEYFSEIVDADTKEEAVDIAKHRIKDRAIEVDEENTCQIEDEELLKELEEDERKADEEEDRATDKPKK